LQRPLAQPTIGIEDDDDIGGIGGQVPHAKLQRIAFAAARRVGANYDFCPCCLGNFCRIVGAIICDHQDVVMGSELSSDIIEGGQYPGSFVVCGNKHARSVGECTRCHGSILPQRQAAGHDLRKPDEG
jgi:hypothetical protein